MYIFVYTVSYLDIFVPLNQYSFPNIESKIFEARFLKRAARQGSLF